MEVIKISRCLDCPFIYHHHEPYAGGANCFFGDDEGGELDHDVRVYGPPPPECPLRKAPVQIQFEEKEGDT